MEKSLNLAGLYNQLFSEIWKKVEEYTQKTIKSLKNFRKKKTYGSVTKNV